MIGQGKADLTHTHSREVEERHPVMWRPSPTGHPLLKRFIERVNGKHRTGLRTHSDLYSWSIEQPEKFWREVWDFCDIVATTPPATMVEQSSGSMRAAWCRGARLNFAENLLRYRDDRPAILFHGETQQRRTLSYRELAHEVARFASALRRAGVQEGDRVAAMIPNMPEAVIAMLATASIGAIWCSCSPDFGVNGVLDRFGQIDPVVLIAAEGYFFKGARIDCLQKLKEVARTIPSLRQVVVVPYTERAPDLTGISHAVMWDAFAPVPHGEPELSFAPLPFDHPLYIMFSSGTTGKPKCIVHGAGGTLLEHLKELMLHTDLSREDTIFYQTTCGWMMWNWLVSSLATGAKLVLYDGSPLWNDGRVLWDMVAREKITVFGTNAKYLAWLEQQEIHPGATHDLTSLRAILSTGSPLLPESFDYVYRNVKADVQLSSISGGTDIIGCFVLGSPLLPVRRGEIQCRSLGYRVEVYNPSGESVVGEKGDLVCTSPFPSMPLGFWNDSDGTKFRASYFERFPGIWHHGDYMELTEEGGCIIYGRSDATLNPGGVRIGTAEIYNQVERIPEVEESLVVGQQWKGDERIVLFVRLQDGVALDDHLRDTIRREIRSNTSPFHVPRKIIAVSDIPRTRSGKITELAVKQVIHGEEVRNREALANPEALDLFSALEELHTD